VPVAGALIITLFYNGPYCTAALMYNGPDLQRPLLYNGPDLQRPPVQRPLLYNGPYCTTAPIVQRPLYNGPYCTPAPISSNRKSFNILICQPNLINFVNRQNILIEPDNKNGLKLIQIFYKINQHFAN
jgi:hypothetical protein